MTPYYYVRRQDSPDPVHETLESAQARAGEMAESEPGHAFEILRCVGIASTSKASTFWMDGAGPPEKYRWRMLEDGELIEDGDEFSRGDEWSLSRCDGQKYSISLHQPHRRPL